MPRTTPWSAATHTYAPSSGSLRRQVCMTLADVVTYNVHTTDIDAYRPASGELVGRFAAVGHVPVGGILAEVSRLAYPPMLVEITVTAVR